MTLAQCIARTSQVFGSKEASRGVAREDRLPTLPFDAVARDLARLLVSRKDSSVACLSPRARLTVDEVRVWVRHRWTVCPHELVYLWTL